MSLQLLKSVGCGDIVKVRQLLNENNSDVNQADNKGNTALIVASRNGNIAAVELLLLEADVDVNQANKFGESPLFLASWKGHLMTVELLLKHPTIYANQSDEHGITPIYIASFTGYYKVVESLLVYYTTQHPKIKVRQVNWSHSKVRMMYLLYNKTNLIVKTPKEVTWCHDIRSFDTLLKQSIMQHSGLYPDLANLIYEFVHPSYTQIMDLMNVDDF